MFQFMKKGEIHQFFLSSLEESKKLAKVSDSFPIVIYTTDDSKAVLAITKHDFFNECARWFNDVKILFQEEKPPLSDYVEMWESGRTLCDMSFEVLKACPRNKDLPDTIRALFSFQHALVDTLLHYRGLLDEEITELVHPNGSGLEDVLAELEGVSD